MPSLDSEEPGIAIKGVYDSAYLHSGGCRLFIMPGRGQVRRLRNCWNLQLEPECGEFAANHGTWKQPDLLMKESSARELLGNAPARQTSAPRLPGNASCKKNFGPAIYPKTLLQENLPPRDLLENAPAKKLPRAIYTKTLLQKKLPCRD
jgi:hypothetical protein